MSRTLSFVINLLEAIARLIRALAAIILGILIGIHQAISEELQESTGMTKRKADSILHRARCAIFLGIIPIAILIFYGSYGTTIKQEAIDYYKIDTNGAYFQFYQNEEGSNYTVLSSSKHTIGKGMMADDPKGFTRRYIDWQDNMELGVFIEMLLLLYVLLIFITDNGKEGEVKKEE